MARVRFKMLHMSAWIAPAVLVLAPPVLWLLESSWPLEVRNRALRVAHARDNALRSLPVLLVGTASGIATASVAILCAERGIGLIHLAGLRGPAATALGFLAFELGDYLRHLAMHRVSWLWRLHRVHHEDPALDLSTAFRNHPLENLFHGLWHSAVVALLGVPLASWLIRTPLLFAALYFQHANLRLPGRADAALAWLTPTPRQHREHHAMDRATAECNYGVLLTLWDRVFATHRNGLP